MLGHRGLGQRHLLGEVGQEQDEGVVGHGDTLTRRQGREKEAGMASDEVVKFLTEIGVGKARGAKPAQGASNHADEKKGPLTPGERSEAAKKGWATRKRGGRSDSKRSLAAARAEFRRKMAAAEEANYQRELARRKADFDARWGPGGGKGGPAPAEWIARQLRARGGK